MKSSQLSAGSHYVQPAESQPIKIASSQRRVSPSRLRPASREPARPASQELARADRIQLAMNHLRVSMSGLSRSSPAGQKSARPNHI